MKMLKNVKLVQDLKPKKKKKKEIHFLQNATETPEKFLLPSASFNDSACFWEWLSKLCPDAQMSSPPLKVDVPLNCLNPPTPPFPPFPICFTFHMVSRRDTAIHPFAEARNWGSFYYCPLSHPPYLIYLNYIHFTF